MKIYTLEAIDTKLKRIVADYKENYLDGETDIKLFFEITADRTGFAVGENHTYIRIHQITSETKMSYVTSTNDKISKKDLTYIERYTKCFRKCYADYDSLLKGVWLSLNKYNITQLLRSNNDFDIYYDLYTKLLEE